MVIYMESRELLKVIVIYDSQSGFTEMMAKFVAEGVKKVNGVEVETLKIGTPFSLSKLDNVNAIILGSPNNYSNITPKMQTFLESLKNMGKLSGKIGGVFGSYSWDKGEVVEKLRTYMNAFGMRIVAPPVSISSPVSIAYRDYDELHMDKEYLQKCNDLGRVVAEQVSM
jgi:NAD(P)H dehydrogenase (quinone)